MDGPPPPPPPHGSNPGTTNGSKHRKASDLPEGQYDIFVVPPHASGSGFLYLPSLQCHRNSFLAGVASTLLVGGTWVVISPILKDWVSTIAASGNGGFILLVVGVGVAGWAWGKSQNEGGFGFGGPNSSDASGPPPGAPPNAGSGPGPGQGGGRGGGAGGTGPNAGAQYPGGSNYGQYAGGNQYSGAGGPNPGSSHHSGGHHRGRQYAADGEPADEGYNTPPPPEDGAHPQEDKESQHEREREEARRKEELRRKMEEMKRQREEEQKGKQKQREREAREREAREREARRQEALRKEKEAKEAAKKEAAAKVAAEEAKKKEALERERAAKETAEKEAAAKFAAARESAAAKFAAAKEAAAIKAAEKEKAAKEAAAKEAREARFKEAKARRAERDAAAKTNGPQTPSPQKKTPYSSAKAADDAYSFRPYDKQRSGHPAATAASIYSESSYAPSQSTAQTTPPPSHRGPYSTKDPDKIIVKGVYSFNNTFMKIPIAQLLSGQGSVTDGLILRITTEGLFIDDDVRGVPQREWDLKAWTLKLAEVWCSQYAASHSARPNPPKSNPFRRSAARTQPIPTSEESDACLVDLLKGCKNQCRLASVSSHRGSNIDGHDSQSGQMKGFHVLRVHIRDQEGKKFVFVLQETEGWKLALGLQRLRKGTQARSLGVCGMPSNETKALLDNLGMV